MIFCPRCNPCRKYTIQTKPKPKYHVNGQRYRLDSTQTWFSSFSVFIDSIGEKTTDENTRKK